jgi:hypothetical protein
VLVQCTTKPTFSAPSFTSITNEGSTNSSVLDAIINVEFSAIRQNTKTQRINGVRTLILVQVVSIAQNTEFTLVI